MEFPYIFIKKPFRLQTLHVQLMILRSYLYTIPSSQLNLASQLLHHLVFESWQHSDPLLDLLSVNLDGIITLHSQTLGLELSQAEKVQKFAVCCIRVVHNYTFYTICPTFFWTAIVSHVHLRGGWGWAVARFWTWRTRSTDLWLLVTK